MFLEEALASKQRNTKVRFVQSRLKLRQVFPWPLEDTLKGHILVLLSSYCVTLSDFLNIRDLDGQPLKYESTASTT